MKYIYASEAQEKLFQIVFKVRHGKTFIVIDDKSGKPIAKIVPPIEETRPQNAQNNPGISDKSSG